MSPRVTAARDVNAGGSPYATVSLGPLLFALPIADAKDANTPDPTVKWQYALDAQGNTSGSDISIERSPLPETWNWPLGSPLKLRATAVRIDWQPTLESPLPTEPFAATGSAEPITLIPYGCTKFRVSMFPVTMQTFRSAARRPRSPEADSSFTPPTASAWRSSARCGEPRPPVRASANSG